MSEAEIKEAVMLGFITKEQGQKLLDEENDN